MLRAVLVCLLSLFGLSVFASDSVPVLVGNSWKTGRYAAPSGGGESGRLSIENETQVRVVPPDLVKRYNALLRDINDKVWLGRHATANYNDTIQHELAGLVVADAVAFRLAGPNTDYLSVGLRSVQSVQQPKGFLLEPAFHEAVWLSNALLRSELTSHQFSALDVPWRDRTPGLVGNNLRYPVVGTSAENFVAVFVVKVEPLNVAGGKELWVATVVEVKDLDDAQRGAPGETAFGGLKRKSQRKVELFTLPLDQIRMVPGFVFEESRKRAFDEVPSKAQVVNTNTFGWLYLSEVEAQASAAEWRNYLSEKAIQTSCPNLLADNQP